MYKFGLQVQLSNKLFEDAVKNGMLDSILDDMFYEECVFKFKEHDLVYSKLQQLLICNHINILYTIFW